jgi:hypothetical protein
MASQVKTQDVVVSVHPGPWNSGTAIAVACGEERTASTAKSRHEEDFV